MQVFKLYFKVLQGILPILILYGVGFAVMIYLYSASLNNGAEFYQNTKIEVAVFNEDENNKLTKNLLDYLNKYFNLNYYYNKDTDLADAFVSQQAVYSLIIPEHFAEDFLSGKDVRIGKEMIQDGMEPNLVDDAVNYYLNTAKSYININKFMTVDQLISVMNQITSKEIDVKIDTHNNAERIIAFYRTYFNLSSYIVLSCCLFGIGLIMLAFQNTNIYQKHMIAPISYRSVNLQLIGGNLVLVIFLDILFILFGLVINHEFYINVNVVLYWLNLFTFSISSLSIGYTAGMLITSKRGNMVVSIILPICLCFISGVFITQTILNQTILKLAEFMPVYWFIQANDAIAGLKSMNLDNVKRIFSYVAIQFGFSAVFFTISLVASKYKSQRYH